MDMARTQHGLFTTRQALASGVTSRQLWRRVTKGELLQVRRSVWALAGAPTSYEQHVLAALLAAGGPSWASHRTAAKLWGLRVPRPNAVDVLTMRGRRLHLAGVQHHQSGEVRLTDIGRVRGVNVTGVGRTLVDCTPWLPEQLLVQAVDDATRRGLLPTGTLGDALTNLDRGRQTGRHLVVPVRPVAADRDPGGSDRELDVLAILTAAGVPLPAQQLRVELPSGPRFLDFGYEWAKVGLEFDGFAEHGLIRSTFDDDRERDAELQLAGWLMLHFTSNTRPTALVDRVGRALDARAA